MAEVYEGIIELRDRMDEQDVMFFAEDSETPVAEQLGWAVNGKFAKVRWQAEGEEAQERFGFVSAGFEPYLQDGEFLEINGRKILWEIKALEGKRVRIEIDTDNAQERERAGSEKRKRFAELIEAAEKVAEELGETRDALLRKYDSGELNAKTKEGAIT